PESVHEILEDEPAGPLPQPVKYALIILAAVATIPPLMIWQKQNERSDKPRVHFVPNMDYQPQAKPQNTSRCFADGRAARPPVEGAVAWGDLEEDDAYYRGIRPESQQPVPARPASFAGGA